MTKKEEEFNLAEGIQKGLEQAIAYKKGDKSKAKTNTVDFEKELEKSVEQLNKFASGDDSEVEVKEVKKKSKKDSSDDK